MPRGISFDVACSRYRLGRDDGIRVRIVTRDACDIPEEVFAYRMLPLDPNTGEKAGTYSHICSPVDLEEYPANAPRVGDSPQWFRLNVIDVLVRSRVEADNLIQQVEYDLRRLCNSLNTMDSISPTLSRQIGDACPAPSSSSSGASTSSAADEDLGELMAMTALSTVSQQLPPGISWASHGDGIDQSGSSTGSPTDYLDVTLIDGQPSKGLLLQGFDFSELPDNARIVGFEIKLWLRSSAGAVSDSSASADACMLSPILVSGPRCPKLLYVGLHQPTLGPGSNAAAMECITEEEFTPYEFGDNGDLWGRSGWTSALVQSGEFGVLMVVSTLLPAPEVVAAVEAAEIIVHYYG